MNRKMRGKISRGRKSGTCQRGRAFLRQIPLQVDFSLRPRRRRNLSLCRPGQHKGHLDRGFRSPVPYSLKSEIHVAQIFFLNSARSAVTPSRQQLNNNNVLVNGAVLHVAVASCLSCCANLCLYFSQSAVTPSRQQLSLTTTTCL